MHLIATARRLASALLVVIGATALGSLACAHIISPTVISAYTVMAPEGGSVARLLTNAPACPRILLDGQPRHMTERSGPVTLPDRTSTSGGFPHPAAIFPLRVCEAHIVRGVHTATVAGRHLPLPRAVIRRVVVIGDTGCRLKAKDNAWQACNDPVAWPFASIAKAAAATHPDLVLHVGDYMYRESACPDGNSGCAGSPSGYGWGSWQADFITPAAPLLAAAPWAMVRGNHEECARAGGGWWLLLDPHPLVAGVDCADPAQDFAGNHSAPYAVELGAGSRIIIADFAAIGEKAFSIAPKLARYREDAAAIATLARPGETNFVSDHYPFGAVTVYKGVPQVGYTSIAQAFQADDGVPKLPNVAAVLSGHVHLLQYAVQAGHPPQLVTGFSGTQEDEPPAPADAQGSVALALPTGLQLDDIATRFGHFGYAVLDRMADGAWRMSAYGVDGSLLLTRVIKRREG